MIARDRHKGHLSPWSWDVTASPPEMFVDPEEASETKSKDNGLKLNVIVWIFICYIRKI